MRANASPLPEPALGRFRMGSGRRAPRPLPILMYHRIAQSGSSELARGRVSPRRFAEQLRFLQDRGYRSVSLDALGARRDRRARHV